MASLFDRRALEQGKSDEKERARLAALEKEARERFIVQEREYARRRVQELQFTPSVTMATSPRRRPLLPPPLDQPLSAAGAAAADQPLSAAGAAAAAPLATSSLSAVAEPPPPPLRYTPPSELTHDKIGYAEQKQYPKFFDLFSERVFIEKGEEGAVYKVRISPDATMIPETIDRKEYYAAKIENEASQTEAKMNLWIAQIPPELTPNIVRPLFWLRVRDEIGQMKFATIMEYVTGGNLTKKVSSLLKEMKDKRNYTGLGGFIATGIAQTFAALCEPGAAGIRNFRHDDTHHQNILLRPINGMFYFVYRYSDEFCLVIPTWMCGNVIWCLTDFGFASGEIGHGDYVQSLRSQMQRDRHALFFVKIFQDIWFQTYNVYDFGKNQTLRSDIDEILRSKDDPLYILQNAKLFSDFRCRFNSTKIEKRVRKLLGKDEYQYPLSKRKDVDLRPHPVSLIEPVKRRIE
jgi:serine/threonine protein kinase